MQREAQGLHGYHYHGQRYKGQSVTETRRKLEEYYTDLL